MKVLHVCPRYHPYVGGIEEHVQNVTKGLAGKHEVTVATTDESGKSPREEVVDGIRVKRFKSWAPSEAYYFSRNLKRYLIGNSDDFDIVHAHSYHALPALYAAQAKGRNKLIFTPHYHGKGHTFFRSVLLVPYKFFGNKIFEKADKIVCVSNYEENLISRDFSVSNEKVVVIPNGIKLVEFSGLEKKNSRRTILCVGRLEKYKGVQYLIEVLSNLADDIALEVVGKGSYKRSLVKLVRKLDLVERVRFFEDLPRNELLQKYACAGVFALLSKYEAYSLVTAEALAAGTPCVVADTSALSEWIDNKSCFGVSFPIDLEELAKQITKAFDNNPDRYSLNSHTNTRIIDWSDVVAQLENIYELALC